MKKILLVSTTGIGDTLFGTPAIRAMRKSFPEAGLYLVAHKKMMDLVRFNPHLNGLYPYRETPLIKLTLALQLRKVFFDHILILHANQKVLAMLKRLRYGEILTHQALEDLPHRIRRPDMARGLHSIERRLKLVEEIGGERDGTEMDLCLDPGSRKRAEDFLSAGFPAKRRKTLVGIQIGAAERIRRWPLENFAQVIPRIRKEYEADIFISGGGADHSLYEQLGRKTDLSGVPFIGSLGLLDGAALMEKSRLFISNDTGPLHIALALGVPTISLYGPSTPDTTGPVKRGEKNIVISRPLPCDPCVERECPAPFCMEAITVEEVWDGARKILALSE